MKLSTKGRYGLRCMIDLAIHSRGEKVSLCAIAERQNISENYLEQVFASLRKAGLVKSIKGAQGGYILAQDPGKVSVGRVLRALEGNLSIIDIPDTAEDGGTVSIQRTIKTHLWDVIDESINRLVDGITLQDLVEDYEKARHGDNIMYHI